MCSLRLSFLLYPTQHARHTYFFFLVRYFDRKEPVTVDPLDMNSEARLGREPTSTLMAELETISFLQVVMVRLHVPLQDHLDLADTTDLALVGVCI